jgi:dTDP-4-amino-4,6-dideoxygalactose transaminase
VRNSYLTFGRPMILEAEIEEVVATLRSGWIGAGPKVERFEQAFRAYTGSLHAVAVSSCSAALHLALVVSGIEPGDEVITTPLTFAATANAIIHAGARPVFVDVDRRTGNIDPARITKAVTARTHAILPLHYAGRPCDMEAIGAIARHAGLTVIEDAAHCIEGSDRGRKVGSISAFTCFSFYPTKNLTTGEGGMVTVKSALLARQLRRQRQHGLSADAWRRHAEGHQRQYDVVSAGFKYTMTDIQASLGLHQLARLPGNLARRAEIWTRYDRAFADLALETPAPSPSDSVHARHLYTVLVDEARTGLSRTAFMRALHARRIGSAVHYLPLHLHRYYRDTFGLRPGDFPNAEAIGERTVSLPLSPAMSEEDVHDVIEAVWTAVCSAARPRVVGRRPRAISPSEGAG